MIVIWGEIGVDVRASGRTVKKLEGTDPGFLDSQDDQATMPHNLLDVGDRKSVV